MSKRQILHMNLTEGLVDQMPSLVGFQEGQEKARELTRYLSPKVYWCNGSVDHMIDQQVLSIDKGSLIIDSAYVAIGLKDSHKVTVLAATIGEKLPMHSTKALEEGRLWEGAIADELGSNAVEALVEKFHQYLRQTFLPQGLFPTLRFGPGYGDWSLTGQKDILMYLETEPDIKVNSSFFLEPVKSITALIGWSKKPQKQEYPQGQKNKSLCQGAGSCSHCQTWACKKQ